MALKIGDVVELKSGSPKMTITAQTERGNWTCSWFSEQPGTSQYQPGTNQADFPEAALRPVGGN
ncbi:DUF2158 domain-containing protein [Caulobacter sp. S45]|uniref:YodC family protein n=1 Tax=Caulobacter sp. S45 TaxID=1641861 RepID=UPI00131D1173